MSWEDNRRIEELERRLGAMEVGVRNLERQLDDEIYKNQRLREELEEAQLEIARLTAINDDLQEQVPAPYSLGDGY